MTNNFGSKIRKLREAIGISQTELEKRIGHEGRGYVYDIERGAFVPSEEKLKKIARALGVSFGVFEDMLVESRLEEMGIKDRQFIAMFKDYPRLTRQDRSAIIKAYLQIKDKEDS